MIYKKGKNIIIYYSKWKIKKIANIPEIFENAGHL